MKRLLALLAFAALSLASRPGAAQAPVEISFGLNAPGAANWIYYIAERRGFFKDEGLHVEMVTSGTPTNTLNILASGGVQLALDGSSEFIEGAVHHLPVKIVAPEFGPSPYVLFTQPSISTWAQLKGKSVLLGPKGDVSATTFSLLAESQHLKPDDFALVPGSTSNARYAGLISGNVGATVLSQPFSVLASQKGMHPLAVAADVVKDWVDTCFGVNTTWAATHRDAVVRMMRALRKAAAYGYAHPNDAIAALIAATNIPPATAAAIYDIDFRRERVFDPNLRMNVKGLLFMAQLTQKYGSIETVPPIADLYDPSYVEEAAHSR